MHNADQHVVKLPEKARRIKLVERLTDEEANEWEIALIELLGRKDLGTGCLRNLTEGGNEGNTGWVPTDEYKQKKAADMREWHRANPCANGAKIREAKLGHEVADETRVKIAKALVDPAEAAQYGFTVDEWVQLNHAFRRRIRAHYAAEIKPVEGATLREVKAAKAHGVEVAEYLLLTKVQRKHLARTKARALKAGIPHLVWLAMTKGEKIQAALAA